MDPIEITLLSVYTIIVFAIQLALSLKTKRIMIKFLPTIVLAFLAFMLYIAAVEFGRTAEGLEALGMLVYLAFMVYALFGIAVCFIACITARIIKSFQRKWEYYDAYDYNYSDVSEEESYDENDKYYR